MSTRALPTATLAAALRRSGFTGPILEPGDERFETERFGWNAAIDRRPAALAFATDAEDVAAAVTTARAADLPLTIRGGGHSVSGRSVRDGALCIDLRRLNGVEVDARSRTVRVGGGTLLRDLDAATQAHGLAIPAGQISHTGVAGLTLGGGIGWLMRRHGLTIDSLRGVEAVLADGSVVHADEDEHADLFWALRGGGGDFAAVTRFEFEAHAVGPALLAGVMVYPFDRAAEALQASRALMASAPDELTIFDVLVTVPPAPPFPPELYGRPAAIVGVAWCGDPAEGAQVVGDFRRACPPLLDLVGPMPYVALQTMLDQTAPPGWNYYDRQHYLPDVSDGAIEVLVAGFAEVPTPEAHVVTGYLGGAIDRVSAGATAFGHRGARAFSWLIGCSGDRPIEPVTDWVRTLWDELEPHASGGVYVNALDAGRPVRDAYADDVWARLVSIKRRYDPEGVFSGNGIPTS